MLDNFELLSDHQANVLAVASYPSTNYRILPTAGTPPLSASAIPFDLGKGTPLELMLQVTKTATSAGAAVLQVIIETDDNTSFSSATAVYTSATIALATLVAGYQLPIRFLPLGVSEKYYRARYVVTVADFTVLEISCGVVDALQTNK
jgi:hypothetical protein